MELPLGTIDQTSLLTLGAKLVIAPVVALKDITLWRVKVVPPAL